MCNTQATNSLFSFVRTQSWSKHSGSDVSDVVVTQIQIYQAFIYLQEGTPI